MDPSILGIVLGVIAVAVGWWLLTASPWGVRRQRQKARVKRKPTLFEQEYAKRVGRVRSSDDH